MCNGDRPIIPGYNEEQKALNLQLVQADLFFTESTSFRSTLAFCFQVLRKISFFH